MIKTPDQLRDKHAEPDGFVSKPNQIQARASTVLLCKDIGDKLEKLYPGWLWCVNADERGGVINIFSMKLSMQYGYIIHIDKIQNDPSRAMAMKAGGEILERYGQPRGPYNYQRWAAAKRKFGLLDFDISDKDRSTIRRRDDKIFNDALRRGDFKLRIVERQFEGGRVHRGIYLQPSAEWER